MAEELELLKRLTKSVESLSNFIPPNTLKMMRSLNDVHVLVQPKTIKDKINNLQSGETFAMFVRAQNCAISFHRNQESPENIIVATFPGKVHPKEVYNHISDLVVRCLHQMFESH